MDLSPLIREVENYVSIVKVFKGYLAEQDREYWIKKKEEARGEILKKARELVKREEKEG